MAIRIVLCLLLSLWAAESSAQTKARQRYIAACTGTTVNVGADWQTLVTAGSAGDTFCIQPGTHYLQSVTSPKNNQKFIGLPGAIMSGARVLTGWTADGGTRWYITGQTQAGSAVGTCKAAYPMCGNPEDTYRDNVLLTAVSSLGAGATGKTYFDYAADRIYVWDDPNGHTMETTLTTVAFSGSATGVLVRGLTIEKYANDAQTGAIRGGSTWSVFNNVVRYNHGGGIGMATSRLVLGNYVHHNGQMGILGTGNSSTVCGNEISYNNTAGFDSYWEAGGTKFTFTNTLLICSNFVHHNKGNGLWADIDNIYITYEDNIVEDNDDAGIHHEISYDAIIRNNRISRNGVAWGATFWVDGACILVADSKNVEVYGNTCTSNTQGMFAIDLNRGSGGLGTYNLEHVHFYSNTVTTGAGAAGTNRTGIGNLDASWLDLTFENNTYNLGANTNYFAWAGGEHNETYWAGVGNDDTGTFNR